MDRGHRRSDAICALSRSVGRSEKVNVDSDVPGRVLEWGKERLASFKAALDQVAASDAADASGVAPGPYLDRWDEQGDSWC